MKFAPFGTKILIEPTLKDKTPGGLLLPETAVKSNIGVVRAVGPGTSEVEMKVSVGDVIKYDIAYGVMSTVKLGEQEYLILDQNAVIGTFLP